MKGEWWTLRFVLSTLVGVFLGGCADEPGLPSSSLTVSDSGGVRFVRVPALTALSLPDLPAERLYSTEDIGGEELELFRVRDALFLRDGTLVIANGGSEELLFVDPSGGSVRRFGGRGGGPGEFEGLRRVISAPNGGFYGWDYRLSQFDEGGRFIKTMSLAPEDLEVSLEPLVVSGDGRIVAMDAQQLFFQASGERRDTVPLMVFGPDGQNADTVGSWMGLERAFFELPSAGTFTVPIGFARTVFHASCGDQIAIGSSDSLDVTVFGATMKPTLRLVSPGPRVAVTEEETSAWRKHVLERLPFDIPDLRRAWEQAPVRGTLPGFEGLEMDADGRLWIGEAEVPGATRRRWVVFNPDGVPEAEMWVTALWPGYLPGSTELLAVSPDRIAVLRQNALDEEFVEVWDLLGRRWQESG